jgi:hypothetical protein
MFKIVTMPLSVFCPFIIRLVISVAILEEGRINIDNLGCFCFKLHFCE